MAEEEDSESGSVDSSSLSDKEQLTALLLSIFLGGFGAGRLYVGDYGLGLFKLLIGQLPCLGLCYCCYMVACGAGFVELKRKFGFGGGAGDESGGGGGGATEIGCCACLCGC